MTTKANAILEINSTAKFIIRGDNPVEWLEGTSPISNSDIDAKVAEITTRDAHIRPRQDAYPSIQDQLDMQYHDLVDDTTTWQDAVQAVKDTNPKS